LKHDAGIMPIKREPSAPELKALAERFKALWRDGDVLRPWLRKHHEMIRELVHDDWSWASVAQALTQAGITWRTGRPWSAEGLRREIVRAVRPLKAGKRQVSSYHTIPKGEVPSEKGAPSPRQQAMDHSPQPTDPRFQPVRLAPIAPQNVHGTAQAEEPTAPKVPRFKAFSLKDQEPPRPLTPEEQQERETIRKRFS
jgi:hypothetical protein